MVENMPANAGDVRDLSSIPGLGRSPGEGMATHSSILAWRSPWTEKPGGLQSMGLQRVGHDSNNLASLWKVNRTIPTAVAIFGGRGVGEIQYLIPNE